MGKLLIALLSLSLSGCASAGLNGGCMHIIANGSYAGSANGAMSGCLCHIGCVGFGCSKPDYMSLAEMQTACINAANNVTTTVPITVAVTPKAK